MFQRVDFAPDIAADSKLRAQVEFATRVLEQAVGNASGLLQLRWDLTNDAKGRPLARMTLKDWTGEVEGFFAPGDLTEEQALRANFYKLYGDLLQIRSHKQLDDLLAGVPTGNAP